LSSSDRAPTGISGLDEILTGGIPTRRVVLLTGGPGTGKTILSTQFLINGMRTYKESAVFVSLDENKQEYFAEMKKFGWDLAGLEEQKKFAFVDASPIRSIPGEVKIGKIAIGKRDFSMLSLVETITAAAKAVDARRIVLDPVGALTFQYPELFERRNATLDLIEALRTTGATCMVNSELRRAGAGEAQIAGEVQLEEYLAHGVIVLHFLHVGKSLVRVLQVEKMRETEVDVQPHPYRITRTGIEVYAKESIF
jgi:KaiC/GvpD/RAD55 family RecA-like ATPase